MMHSFGFKVIPPEDKIEQGVPISVAGQTMVDVQKLLTDVGCMMVRAEMRIQNKIPKKLISKFNLNIGGSSDEGLGMDPSEGNEAIMEDALKRLGETLDFVGKGLGGDWMITNFPDEFSRREIAKDLLDLAEHLKGYILIYGPEDDLREFKKIDPSKIAPYVGSPSAPAFGAVIGSIYKDHGRKQWVISNDGCSRPISFGENIHEADIPVFASAGPVIVAGDVTKRDGVVSSVSKITGCYAFPEVKFHRIISEKRDIILLNPIVAKPKYTKDKGWTLSYDLLGATVTKPTWDECVVAFHDYITFLWDTYGKDGEYTGEEKEIHDFLMSLLPA